MRAVAWFSCGAASAVAAKITVEKYGADAEVVYCDTMISEHPDQQRFFDDVQNWIGKPITRIKSDRYDSVDEVFEKRRYLSGIKGALCTVEMKKMPRFAFQRADDLHVFGYTADEGLRIKRFREGNPELYLWWPLQEAEIDKQECYRRIEAAGIRLPAMYRLGYKNNNCLGCVKASSTKYWNSIRRDFPMVFDRRVQQSRELGVRLTRNNGERIFLDELPPDDDDGVIEDISCGPECGIQGKLW